LIAFNILFNRLISDNISSNVGNLLGSQSVWESIEQDYSPDDLTGFQTNFQLPIEPVAKDIGGYNLSSTCVDSSWDCGEANLDVQYMMAVSQVTPTVYYYDNSTDFLISWAVDLLNMADPPLVNSISYGCEESELDEDYAQTANNLFMMLAARGVTVVVSSGDDGAPGYNARYNESLCSYSPEWPASMPYVLSVGATQGPESDKPEIACASNTGGVITSGGGFSNLYKIPSWQVDTIQGAYFSYINIAGLEPAQGFNISGRGYPDISALGFNYNVLLGSFRPFIDVNMFYFQLFFLISNNCFSIVDLPS
jgi:tripeptidyl-peptidase-1